MSEKIRILNEELRKLNDDVFRAIQIRTEWMNNHVVDYAQYQIGETIYNELSGELLGSVVGFFRYNENRPDLDTNMGIGYVYKTPQGHIEKSKLLRICNKSELLLWNK